MTGAQNGWLVFACKCGNRCRREIKDVRVSKYICADCGAAHYAAGEQYLSEEEVMLSVPRSDTHLF